MNNSIVVGSVACVLDQFGFSNECSRRDTIAALTVMCERSLENNNKVYVSHVDSKKAFDRINWVKLIAILADIGVDWTDKKCTLT